MNERGDVGPQSGHRGAHRDCGDELSLPRRRTDPQELWGRGAGQRRDLRIPTDRGWNLEKLSGSDPGQSGKSYAYEGGFVYDATDFDAGFFGIGPREALGMDPQQRLLLEIAWEALEDAGINPTTLRGSQTGVFVGTSMQDYLSAHDADANERDGFG